MQIPIRQKTNISWKYLIITLASCHAGSLISAPNDSQSSQPASSSKKDSALDAGHQKIFEIRFECPIKLEEQPSQRPETAGALIIMESYHGEAKWLKVNVTRARYAEQAEITMQGVVDALVAEVAASKQLKNSKTKVEDAKIGELSCKHILATGDKGDDKFFQEKMIILQGKTLWIVMTTWSGKTYSVAPTVNKIMSSININP